MARFRESENKKCNLLFKEVMIFRLARNPNIKTDDSNEMFLTQNEVLPSRVG